AIEKIRKLAKLYLPSTTTNKIMHTTSTAIDTMKIYLTTRSVKAPKLDHFLTEESSLRYLAIDDCSPSASTRPTILPEETTAPAYSFSPMPISFGSVSPVRKESSMEASSDSTTSISTGATDPATRCTTSPSTSSLVGISTSLPLRNTYTL